MSKGTIERDFVKAKNDRNEDIFAGISKVGLTLPLPKRLTLPRNFLLVHFIQSELMEKHRKKKVEERVGVERLLSAFRGGHPIPETRGKKSQKSSLLEATRRES